MAAGFLIRRGVLGVPPGRPVHTWTVMLDGEVYGQPLVVGDRVFAVAERNTLYALDIATGAVLWRCPTPARFSVATDGSIKPGWQVPLQGAGSPVVGGRTVRVVDSERGQLNALDPATGRIRRQLAVGPVPHFASPALSGARIVHGTMAGLAVFT